MTAAPTVSSALHPRMGWIGLGSMGLGMATNLQNHLKTHFGGSLQYHNRTMSRGALLEKAGGAPQPNIINLVKDTDIVFISLSDDKALEATLDAILDDAAAADLTGKIFVDTSTVHPLSSAKARERLAAKQAKFIAAPVFGASPIAAQGTLLWIVAGPDEAVEKIQPFVVGVMGRGIIRLGEDVQKASIMKTAGNFLTAGMMELVAEAQVFAEKSGLGSEAMEDLLGQQYGPLALTMSKRLTTGAYLPPRDERPWSDLTLAMKDVGHGLSCAEQVGVRLDIAEIAARHLKEAKKISDTQRRAFDSSSLYGIVRKEAGLDFETEFIKKRDGSA
ncbi:hypothetical protein CORC01_00791 [Colletotrichum orchidophilum]|uniref:6-phosphogluconate dehydrogenase NADP-binding domain-containing protein n=1 Tax=Colletotrichum orchidophilum TaxID=1209926 RepID=A0A1G4BR56_9PEZI|nr:uncharacterized protein CORC01_00791 [Colletotrichum orchidophilum]OHF03929.1 hypothetical protein CORC01_00791 [Colletotrichum orchidophilum]